FEAAYSSIFENYKGTDYPLNEFSLAAETQRLKWLGLTGSYLRGTAVNHSYNRAVGPFRAAKQEAQFEVAVWPMPRLELKQALDYEWLRTFHDQFYPGEDPRRVYVNWILTSKLKYQVTRELSLRGILNYEALLPDTSLSRASEQRTLVPDFLVTYLLNPWT